MCGIAGIVSGDPELRSRIVPMTRVLSHRGPDDHGVAHFDGAVLGHQRLSILDLEGGHQPMLAAGGHYGLVFNGEIYNYPALRRRLEAEGRRFLTRSDTEVILHLYDLYGDDCVLHLEGMFAFGLWDGARNRLLLARDHLGQKPLVWCERQGSLLFASEIKALLASGAVQPELDAAALYDYISLRYLPEDLTLLNGVRKLPAGHRLVWEHGAARVSRYWQLSFHPTHRGSEPELVSALDQRLEQSVRDHLLADVPVGCFLSGGIDSSLMTAYAARSAGPGVPTFSIGVAEESFNELPYARMVAGRYHTDHHEEIASADLVRLTPEMVWHLEEPADPFGVGVYLVSRLAARHVKVVLSGDGGDELFAGYDRFAGQALAERWAMIPRPIRARVLARVIDRLPESFGYKGWTQKLRWLNAMSLENGAERYAQSLSFLRFTEDAKARLFTGEVRARLSGRDSRQRILDQFNGSDADTLVDRMLFTDLTTRIPEHLLPIVDRMAMAHGLEVRPPMLEHRVVEFAARLPSHLKLRRTRLKHILREVGRRHLPPELINRPKQGFGFPLGLWMQRELAPFLRGLARESRFVQQGLFEPGYINQLVEEHLSGTRDHNYRLWILLNLEVWHRLFLENRETAEVAAWVDRRMTEHYAAAG